MVDFASMFRDYNVPYIPGDKKMKWVNTRCPLCGDRTENGGFNSEGGYYHCWRCGSHPMDKVLPAVLGVTPSHIKEILSQYTTSNIIRMSLNNKEKKVYKLDFDFSDFNEAERRYLIKRGLDPKLLYDKYGVRGGGIVGKWRYRIMIPLIVNGKVVSYIGRTILSKKQADELHIPRYKNLSKEESVVNSKDVLFNIDHCRDEMVVLTEGCFDVFKLGDGFCCSLGTELTEEQIKYLSNNYKKVYIMLDNEQEAQVKARKIGMKLASMGVDVEIVDCYSDFGVNDGGELNSLQVKEIRKFLGMREE